MIVTASRILSLIVALTYVACWYCQKGLHPAIIASAEMTPGLFLIWFADYLGEYVGPAGRGHVTQATPAILITIAGWAALICVPLFSHASLVFLLR